VSNIQHPEMVKGLAKSGAQIINDFTPDTAHILHMAIGIAGESGELASVIHSKFEFEAIDKKNVVEELGDLEFYLEGFRQGLGISRLETIVDDTSYDMDRGIMSSAKNGAMFLNIASSILLDQIKKVAFYVKPVNTDNVVKSLIKIEGHMYILRKCFYITYEQTLEHNIAKLGDRYQGHQYSDEQAIARADKN